MKWVMTDWKPYLVLRIASNHIGLILVLVCNEDPLWSLYATRAFTYAMRHTGPCLPLYWSSFVTRTYTYDINFIKYIGGALTGLRLQRGPSLTTSSSSSTLEALLLVFVCNEDLRLCHQVHWSLFALILVLVCNEDLHLRHQRHQVHWRRSYWSSFATRTYTYDINVIKYIGGALTGPRL
jgi:hypothetical protein